MSDELKNLLDQVHDGITTFENIKTTSTKTFPRPSCKIFSSVLIDKDSPATFESISSYFFSSITIHGVILPSKSKVVIPS